MSNETNKHSLNLNPDNLKSEGFTNSGEVRFKETIQDYLDTLYRKSINYGELDRAKNLPREITHDHVKAAAHSIAQSYGKNRPSKLQNIAHVCEYIAAAICGAGASNLDKTIGVIGFVAFAILGVLLFTYRVIRY